MEETRALQRAIGRYRPPRFELVAATLGGLIWIGIGSLDPADGLPWFVGGLVVIAIAWLVPAVVIGAKGIRLPRRLTFIPWSEVTKVFQPGPGDPVRIQRSSGNCVTLYGVDGSRVPDIVVLARKNVDGPSAGH